MKEEPIIICDYEHLSRSKLNKIVDFEALRLFAMKHKGIGVNLAEFVRDANVVSFSYVRERIRSLDTSVFIVLWDLNCCYNSTMEISYRECIHLSKKDLLNLMKLQLEDMDGEILCFVKDIQRVPYWDMLIYDETYTWCMSITHEDADDGTRMCMCSKML